MNMNYLLWATQEGNQGGKWGREQGEQEAQCVTVLCWHINKLMHYSFTWAEWVWHTHTHAHTRTFARATRSLLELVPKLVHVRFERDCVCYEATSIGLRFLWLFRKRNWPSLTFRVFNNKEHRDRSYLRSLIRLKGYSFFFIPISHNNIVFTKWISDTQEHNFTKKKSDDIRI